MRAVEVQSPLGRADLALERLGGAASALSNAADFAHVFLRKETVLSMQVEGKPIGIADLLMFELDHAVQGGDVIEGAGHVLALEYGLRRVRDGDELSGDLLREMHRRLVGGRRTADAASRPDCAIERMVATESGPRTSLELTGDGVDTLARELQVDRARTSPLVLATVAHARVQTRRPFDRANGPMSRLVTLLVLCAEAPAHEPLLCPSLYLKRHRHTYVQLLDGVRRQGAWGPWLDFFADTITAAARNGLASARRLARIVAEDLERIGTLGHAARSARAVHAALQRRPLGSIGSVAGETGLGVQAVTWSLHRLRALGIVRETTGRRRHRVYSYERYLNVLAEGTGV